MCAQTHAYTFSRVHIYLVNFSIFCTSRNSFWKCRCRCM